MTDRVYIRRLGAAPRDRWVGAWRFAASQPNWVLRVALVTFTLVIVVPVLLIVGLAVLAAAAAFTVLALANAAVNRMRGLLPRRDGRNNVRVVRPPDRD